MSAFWRFGVSAYERIKARMLRITASSPSRILRFTSFLPPWRIEHFGGDVLRRGNLGSPGSGGASSYRDLRWQSKLV